MTVKKSLINAVSTMFAASLLAVGASAYAGSTHSSADMDRTPSQTPVDCKEKPEDASCKDKK